jgi:hypothetical protein
MNTVDDDINERIRRYADILNELFDATRFNRIDHLFELVCTLVRAGGIQGPGWDPWYESKALTVIYRSLRDPIFLSL